MDIIIRNEGTPEEQTWGAYDQDGNFLFDRPTLDECYREIRLFITEREDTPMRNQVRSCIIELL